MQTQKKDSKPSNPGGVKVMNIITESAQKQQTPQLLKELEIPTRQGLSKITKNSQEFNASVPTISYQVPPYMLPAVQPMNQLTTPLKDLLDQTPSTNNYSNNTFSQTIFINPATGAQQLSGMGQYLDASQAQNHQFGMTMPTMPAISPLQAQAVLPTANLLQQQMLNPLLMQQQQAFNFGVPQMFMNQAFPANPYMPVMGTEDYSGYGGQGFDQPDLTEEQLQFMSMFEMFKDSLLQDTEEEIDRAIQEEEFEKRIFEADKFVEELRSCECCRGYPLKCKGAICANLGTCHCAIRKTKEEEEANKDKIFVEERKSCNCCKGYIYACKGVACKISGRCQCDAE